jgi:hypothetical protein
MAGRGFIDYKDAVWKDMTVYFNGVRVGKIQGIKYKASMKKELLHVEGDKAVSIQAGNREQAGSIKVLKSLVDNLNLLALAAGGDDLLDLSLDIVIKYRMQGLRPIQIDTLVGWEFTEYEKGWEQGATSMPIELPGLFLDLKSI